MLETVPDARIPRQYGREVGARLGRDPFATLNAREPASNRLSMTFQLEFDSAVTSGEIDLP